MDCKVEFLVFCLEEYKRANQLNGKQVINRFNQYGVLDYIMDYYDSLHTTGSQYIVEDIDQYIEARQ